MKRKAYGRLEIKQFDEDERIIEGIASTPSMDRGGDSLNPEGAVFTLPLPLLWQHGFMEPIGQVIEAVMDKQGIRVKAKVAKVDEAGALRERLTEAWQSLRAGLVRGFSVGWLPLEDPSETKEGLRYDKWEWLELSPVTIPMNQEATILSIKRAAEADVQPKRKEAAHRPRQAYSVKLLMR